MKSASSTMSFRPLTGILFFNEIPFSPLHTMVSMVSVPLRGFCFSTVQYGGMFVYQM